MKFKKRLLFSILFTIVIFATAFFIEIIPCQISQQIPGSQAKWSMCALNNQQTVTVKYFGWVEESHSYLITIIILFLCFMVLLHFIARKKNK